MFSFEGARAPCRMTQCYISRKRDITPVSLLVASARTRYAGLLRGKGNEGKTAGEVRLCIMHCSLCTKYAPLAQLVEQLTLNQWVPGSSP